jgi:hypothetical protein
MTGMIVVMMLDMTMDRMVHLLMEHGIIVEMKKVEMMHTMMGS